MKIYVSVDRNDGDYDGGYVGELSNITEKQLERLKSIIAKCDDFNCWGDGDCLDNQNNPRRFDITDEDVDFVNEFCPYCEYGFHTIEEIIVISGEATTIV